MTPEEHAAFRAGYRAGVRAGWLRSLLWVLKGFHALTSEAEARAFLARVERVLVRVRGD